MAIKVQFEIGHSSELKLKKTSEGFTHDWELYVQGVDKADINQFVERVVFNLHSSFRKPRRSYKQPPYALKESGYAGFALTIDIYFRNREEPRSVTFNYDLDLQQSGPPVHRREIKRYVFENPSEDFRQRLLKGGGIPVVAGGSAVGDDKNRSGDDVNRSQLLSKPKLSSDYGKKHKSRSDDKTNTFANLFGPPITKSTPKVSPDPKTKSSPALSNNITVGPTQSSRDKAKDKAVISAQTFGSKDKEKVDKKDRHKYNSPHKDKPESRDDNKKSNEDKHDKHDKREEKKKDRIIGKERDRSRDQLSKRPLSPKRSSPARSSSAASREEPIAKVSKQNASTLQLDGVSLTSSSNSKKSKKEKKSHDKEKDRDRKEKDRSDFKHRDERSNSHSNSAILSSSMVPSNEKQLNTKNSTRPNDNKNLDGSKKGKDSPLLGVKDVLKDSKKSNDFKQINERLSGIEKKTLDKDEKRHKHKKKDKTKDKDIKDLHKEKKSKEKLKHDNSKKMHESPPRKVTKNCTAQSPINIAPTQQKQTAMTAPTTSSQLETSDLDSLDSDSGSHHTNPKSVPKPLAQSDSSSSSFPDILPTSTSKSSSSSTTALSSSSNRLQQQSSQQFTPEDTNILKSAEKKDKKIHKTHEKPIGKADNKKRRRNSPIPTLNTFIEPPIKLPKKDMPIKNGGRDKSQSPQLPAGTTIIREDEMQTFRPPASTMSLSSNSNLSYDRSPVNSIPNNLSGEYFCELQELHHKIMALQDNNELQQIVEIIAVTGKYEITKKTFDFDLCKLDRLTIQRLQEFFIPPVS